MRLPGNWVAPGPMGPSLRMCERDLKVAQISDCISACFAHIPGEGYRHPLQRSELRRTIKARSLQEVRALCL